MPPGVLTAILTLILSGVPPTKKLCICTHCLRGRSAGALGAIEARQQHVQIDGQGVHHHDFAGSGAHESSPLLAEDLVVGVPGGPGAAQQSGSMCC